MIDSGYLYLNDKSRLFINTALGCNSNCSYCYLPQIGYANIDGYKKYKELIKDIKKLKDINQNTLISFGCYSECWDTENKKETKKFLKYFLKNGFQVQLSTKRRINESEIISLNKYIKYRGQLVIFVSCSTITEWEKYEKGTVNPYIRFKNFDIMKKNNIPIVLYIKPVLKNITIKDINLYIELINKYKIKDVVVGSIFKKDYCGEKAPFSKEKNLFYSKEPEEDDILNKLSNYASVFTRSMQVMKKYNNK